MCFSIALLQEREPRLLWVLALGKVEGGAIGLVNSPVRLFWVTPLELIEQDPVEVAFLVIWFGEVKLRAC